MTTPKIHVFLGGTCNNDPWRDVLISMLSPQVSYFNPVVEDWTEADQAREIYHRENCDYCLYVITPKMTGFFSIAEVTDDSNKRPDKTLFCILGGEGLTGHQAKSLKAVSRLVASNGAAVFNDLNEVVAHLNAMVNLE